MSTTLGAAQGVVYMVDAPDAIRKKFKSAVTDSGPRGPLRPAGEARHANLLEIMKVATGEPVDDLEQPLRRRRLRRSSRRRWARRWSCCSSRFRSVTTSCARDERELQRLLAVGAEKARRAGEPTLEAMYDRMGFVKAEAGRLFGAARPRGL